MTGYSQTPLVKKLGILPGFKLLLIHIPKNYDTLIDQWPRNITILEFKNACEVDFIHFFTQKKAKLETEIPILKKKLKKDGIFWISWPKGRSNLLKDFNENDVRRIGLGSGLVDVKVCAIDGDWSGLKFMYRKRDR